MTPSSHVDGARLWDRIIALAQIGARDDGGVDRQALTPAEIDARAQVIAWGRASNLLPFTDSAANLFLRLEGSEPGLAPVLCGSHLDSQPTGGKFDGSFGVLAALEALVAIRETGTPPRRPIELVAWTNEEGSRFSPGMTGSELYTQVKSLADISPIRDAVGTTLGDALAAVLAADAGVPHRAFGRAVAAFVEPHIEQGPLLERSAVPIGVVTGIQGTRRYRVRVRGAAAHAGTAERHERRDALLAAARMVVAIDRAAFDPADIKLTVGMLQVTPNAPSVVPAETYFSIDLRHPDNAIVDRVDADIRRIVEHERGPCDVVLEQIQHSLSLEFNADIRALISQTANDLDLPNIDIHSAAGHDARQLHYICPTGMIFVPCRGGISHSPEEWADPADITAGARVLTDVVWRLATG